MASVPKRGGPKEPLMSRAPLMPKATAVWLVDNTSLTFEQIAEFCGLHVLEIKGIADGDVAQGIKGMDPIASGQLTRDEIKKGQADTAYRLKISGPKVEIPVVKTKKGPRYTPVSRRQDRPNAILWLLRHHPEVRDSQVMRLVGTTKPTIESIRERTHWNSPNLQPQDPVTLGLCTQIDLDNEVRKAAKRIEREQRTLGKDVDKAGTLLPAEQTTAEPAVAESRFVSKPKSKPDEDLADWVADRPAAPAEEEAPDADTVFGKLAALKQDEPSPEGSDETPTESN